MAFRPVFGGFIEWSIDAMALQNGQLSQNDLDQISSNDVNGLIDSLLRELAKRNAPLPRHGRISNPKSRAQILYEKGELDFGQVNECEGGKGFPALVGNLPDPDAPDDVYNRPPPADGEIASGGHTEDARDLLNATGSHWPKHDVTSGQELSVIWEYRQVHKTRRWTYWITKDGWNPDEPLARKHFEPQPLKVFLNTFQPYYAPGSDILYPPPIHQHKFNLPNRLGYHIILAVWDVANTAAAFYQVIDVDFTS